MEITRFLISLLLIWSVLGQPKKLEKLPDPFEDYVTVLTKSTFQKAIEENDYIVVDVYANWCAHCIDFAPDFSKFGKLLSERGVKDVQITAAKIDMADEDDDKQLAQKYQIKYYPSVIFFIKGVPISYERQTYKSPNVLLDWVKEILRVPTVQELNTEEQVQNFIKSNQYSAIYFGVDNPADNPRYWPFNQLAYTQDGNDFEMAFGIVRDETDLIAKYATRRGTIVGFKLNDDDKVVERKFNLDMTKDNLMRFLLQLTLSTIIPFDSRSENIMKNGNELALLLFLNSNEACQQAEQEYLKFAQSHESEYLFLVMRNTDSSFWTKLDQMGSRDKEFPQLYLLKPSGSGNQIKYRFNQNRIDQQTLQKFIQDYKKDIIPRIWLSATPSAKNEGYVKVVVGNNFIDEVHKVNQDVIVYLYASAAKCTTCTTTTPVFEETAWKFRNNKEIKFVKINMEENEIPLTVLNLPMLYYFPKNLKRAPIHYEKDITTVNEIASFINSYATFDK